MLVWGYLPVLQAAVNSWRKTGVYRRHDRVRHMASNPPQNEYESALAGWLSTRPDETDSADEGDPFGARKDEGLAHALGQVREWVRKRFNLSPETAILVSEVACNLPGCPPLETVIAFWEGEKRHHFKLFKKLREVAFDDLPYTWMKDELVVPEGFECECC